LSAAVRWERRHLAGFRRALCGAGLRTRHAVKDVIQEEAMQNDQRLYSNILLITILLFFLTPVARAAALPDFTLQDIDGTQFHMSERIGKEVVIITFWAMWCTPCKQLLTRLEKMRLEHPGILVLAISVDDSTTLAGVKPYVAGKKFGFPVLLDTDSKVLRMFDPEKKVPVTVVADKSGNIVYSRVGYLPGDEREILKIVERISR
jgi:cytochrome c biogenesis protein CcmG/thiol:disulfide interchange protein DsbE